MPAPDTEDTSVNRNKSLTHVKPQVDTYTVSEYRHLVYSGVYLILFSGIIAFFGLAKLNE